MTVDPVVVARFWAYVDQAGADECWEWTAYTDRDGYGRFFAGGRMRLAPDLALTFATGEVRAVHLETCHSCHNPGCCNPAHLRFDTHQANTDDRVEADRQARGTKIGSARLTESDVVTIRERYVAGATGCSLAKEYGVSQPSVSRIVTGVNWKHAGGPIYKKPNTEGAIQ